MPRPANPELVNQILRVTAEVLQEKGVDGVTMRGVAELVGCSPTIIYHYFQNKDGLFHAAVAQGMAWFAEAEAKAGEGKSGLDLLRANSRGYVEWGIRNPAMYRLMYEQRLPNPAEGEELERRRGGWVRQREMLAAIFAQTNAHAPDLDVATNLVFTGLHGIVSVAVSGRLWGPMTDTETRVKLSLPLVEALVDGWAVAWGLGV
jgi:AcrR family transcriptional regulator